jgi:hypothetical protein
MPTPAELERVFAVYFDEIAAAGKPARTGHFYTSSSRCRTSAPR